MRKTRLFQVVGIAVAILVTQGIAWSAEGQEGMVLVKLSGFAKAVTQGKGTATFETGKDGNSVHYKLDVENVNDVTAAHVHMVGDQGYPRDILVGLYPAKGQAPSPREGAFSGTLAEGDITSDQFVGPMKHEPLKDLLKMLKEGRAGVMVHTKQNPNGELWGAN
jgi:hypothetical protein